MIMSSSLHVIAAALKRVAAVDFTDASHKLLTALGYRSDRTLDRQTGNVADFIVDFPAKNPGTVSEQAFAQQATAVQLIFQVTNDEIQDAVQAQGRLDFEQGLAQSFLFMAVELKGTRYPRGQYANFTRALNKRFPAPTVVLFKTADHLLTLAFVHRRAHKHHPDRDVLGSVSLVREIHPTHPHRAHLDILQDLSLSARLGWMNTNGQPHNFDGLLAAWLDALDTEELNRQFYRELFAWFNRATQEATFPTKETKTQPPEEHIILLLTRLLFVWFIKEKGLVAGELFNEAQVKKLLQDYDRAEGDSYYRAILQNLFFATLNTEVHRRGFSSGKQRTHRDPSRYRYENEIADPDTLLKLFTQTPFINGGLFDCLDSYEAKNQGGYRIDCFSDNPNQRKDYSIPNKLFFDDKGLLPLFKSYKFTVEENTPTEQEVALDPELLGKVFENLLAAYFGTRNFDRESGNNDKIFCAKNPETRSTARKQTGSYYTPRPVVDFMVDEALTAAIAQRCQLKVGDMEFWQARLRYLLDYADAFNDADELFEESERLDIVRAIAHLTVLDPAVGSGAFPMGVLHKLTLALRRLDPQNRLWEELQKEIAGQRALSAFDTQDQQARAAQLTEISDTFGRYRDSDFGRKLFLIQNTIFGVDIQTIATQIAKLRFFISLAIEQESSQDATDNYGIKPLPNLETRFVAADTLLALDTLQGSLAQTDTLQQELNTNRERYFHATTRQQKLACREKDKELRNDLAAQLKKIDMPAADADKIAQWDPYDQNASADWFDPAYMFGVREGFDVVIGNPPYINIENLSAPLKHYLLTHYQTCEKRTDMYIAFLENSLSLLNLTGIVSFIIPAAFTKQIYATKMRRKLVHHHSIHTLVDASSYRIFENAVVYNIVLIVTKNKRPEPTKVRLHLNNADFASPNATEFLIDQAFFDSLQECRFDTNPSITSYVKIQQKIWQHAICLDQICLVAYGARLNHRSAKIGKAHYIQSAPGADSKRFCEGRNIKRYSFSQAGWLQYRMDEHYNPMFPQLFENKKLMSIRIVKDRLRFAYDDEGFYNSHTVINYVRLDLLAGISHSSAVRAIRTADIAMARRFDYRFLLAILNAHFTTWYFLTFLSDKLNFYPNNAKRLPIPKITATEQRPFMRLVDSILAAKYADPSADTSALEAEIDRLVYTVYGLTDEEIALLETSKQAERSNDSERSIIMACNDRIHCEYWLLPP